MDANFVLTLGTVVPATLAIVQGIKNAELVPTNYLQLLSLVIGTVCGLVISISTQTDIVTGAFAGLLGGSTATAGFAAVKNTVTELKNANSGESK